MNFEYINIDKLNFLNNNPRSITTNNFEKLKKSIQNNPDYFEARPLIVSDRTGELVVIAGNQRLKASQELGLKQVPCCILKNLTEEREKEIIIRDNVELGDWDYDLLANEWETEDLQDWGVDIPAINEIDFSEVEDLSEETYKEPDKKYIRCPKCGHIDASDRFMHAKSVNELSEEVSNK